MERDLGLFSSATILAFLKQGEHLYSMFKRPDSQPNFQDHRLSALSKISGVQYSTPVPRSLKGTSSSNSSYKESQISLGTNPSFPGQDIKGTLLGNAQFTEDVLTQNIAGKF